VRAARSVDCVLRSVTRAEKLAVQQGEQYEEYWADYLSRVETDMNLPTSSLVSVSPSSSASAVGFRPDGSWYVYCSQ
jgi:hypothetical protein